MPDPESAPVPRISRRAFKLEAWSVFFFSAVLAFIEGGTIAVLVKQTFGGLGDARWHNIAVALAGGAGEIANLVSFTWITLSHGKPKGRFINKLQMALAVLVAAMALVPRTPTGLWVMVGLVIAARVCWSGIVTLRASVWRANYPPHARAQMVGRLSIITQVSLAVLGMAIGVVMDASLDGYRWIAPTLAATSLVGVVVYRRIRPRGERAALAEERAQPRAAGVMRPWAGVVSTIKVLRGDRRFAQFMLFMFVLGFGNLMVPAVNSIAIASRFGLADDATKAGVMVTTTLPYLLMPLTVPLWAKLLDRSHVVRFRALHGWTFVIATGLFTAGLATRSLTLMYLGAIFWGVGMGGGTLAWNLGHVDFAPPSQSSHYMATHVTLNGVRGLLAPLLASNLYNLVSDHAGEPKHAVEPGAIVMGVSMALTILGCAGFVWLNRSMGREMKAMRR